MRIKKPPDKENHIKYNLYRKSYKSVKTSLKSIVKDDGIIQTINDTILIMNKIVIHTYQFLKYYCINQLKESGNIPIIDYKFILLIMKTVAESNNNNGQYKDDTLEIKNKLDTFYDNYYGPLVADSEKPVYTHLTQMMDYESKYIITCLSNHIMINFTEYISRYINIVCNKTDLELKIRNRKDIDKKDIKPTINKFRSELKQLKNDIINQTDNSDIKYSKIKKDIRKKILNLDVNSDDKIKSINYKVVADPLSYLIPLIKMSMLGETIMAKKMSKKPKDEQKLFNIINCFPQRKSLVPKYVTLDTTLLVNILMKKQKRYYTMNILKLRDEIWSAFFKTGKSVFRKNGYTFSNQISTDGISCSILLIRNDLYDPIKKVTIRTVRKPADYKNDIYVDDLTSECKRKIQTSTIVGIDPGVEDLIYATNGDTKIITKADGRKKHKTTTFRYSRMQRRKETKSRKYSKIEENDKKQSIINGKTVKQIESKLSSVNFNSCILSNIKKNIKLKNKTNAILSEYYSKDLYRKLRWFGKINRDRSEANMLNRFEKTFGKPEDMIIFMGDWSTCKNMSYKEPTKGKGLRKLFKDRGYKLYLVDEYNTSKRMYETGYEMTKFRYRKSGNKEKTKDILVHGLIKTKFTEGKPWIKTTLMNRDLNGSLNIRQKGIRAFYNASIPSHLSRKLKVDNKDLHEDIVKGDIKKVVIVKGKKRTNKSHIRRIIKRQKIN